MQFDSAEFAKMHQAEHEYRRNWLEKKIADCKKKIAEGILSPSIRVAVLEDMVMFQDILDAMYVQEKEVKNEE
jgi:hypothetical protein